MEWSDEEQADKRCNQFGKATAGAVTLPDGCSPGAQYRQPAESATVNPYGGRTEAAAPDAGGMRKRERLKRSVRFFAGGLAGLLLSVGAETSRAIYTSQYLKRRNPVLHDKLQNLGDLDLLYFHVEDIVKPFETACMASDKNPAEFNKICEYFFGGLWI